MRIILLAGMIFLTAIVFHASAAQPIVIGSKDFTEQLILGEITKILLKDNGYAVEDKTGLAGTMINHLALTTGKIDVYWEYTGTAYVVILGKNGSANSPQMVYDIVKDEYKKKWNLIWLQKAQYDNTYAIIMTKQRAKELHVDTISDLAKIVHEDPTKVTFASDAEFLTRPDGLSALEQHYGFTFPEKQVTKMGTGITYLALEDGKVDAALGFSTDANIKKFGLQILKDDKRFFPVYNPAPVVRAQVIEKDPGIAYLLNEIGPRLSQDDIVNLNYMVDIDGKSPEEVARLWLEKEGLIKPSNTTAGSLLEQQVYLLLQKTGEHLYVSLLAIGIASIIGLGTGTIMAYLKNNILTKTVMNWAVITVTIPSVAMFGLIVPIFGIGLWPAIVVLVMYALLPILRNTLTGLTGIRQEIVSSATGIGLSKAQILYKIRIPMSVPIIAAGLRNSVVMTVGLVTIASLIGSGGLGDLIFQGIQQSNTDLILQGTILVAAIAVLSDIGLKRLERRLGRGKT